MRLKVCLVILISFLISACSSEGIYSLKVILGGDLVVERGQVENSEIILLDGSLTVDPGGRVEGSIYQLLGQSTVSGEVTGNIVQLNGDLQLNPSAEVGGILQHSGGEIKISPQAVIKGGLASSATALPDAGRFQAAGGQNQLAWATSQVLLLSVLAFIAGWVFPAPLGRVRLALGEHPVVSGAMGLLVGLVGISLLVQMAFTILLIPVTILGLFLFGFAVAFGWIGFGDLIGNWFFRRIHKQLPRPVTSALGTLVFMIGLYLISLLPGIGDWLSILTAIIGLGAIFLTRFGLRRFVPSSLEEPTAKTER